MTPPPAHPRVALVLALGVVSAAAACLAQWAASNQVGGRTGGRVGGELYGNQGTTGSVRYASHQTHVLPSEARYAAARSGALPSEMRMNASAAGPMTPNGVVNYIPPQSTVQQAMKLPAPQLYNPAYGIGGGGGGATDAGPPVTAGLSTAGTVRYAGSTAEPRPGQLAGNPMGAGPGQFNTGQSVASTRAPGMTAPPPPPLL
ncbi:MAG: hypothetical protein ACAI43_19385, partial [Phycisphaerae bacterium]